MYPLCPGADERNGRLRGNLLGGTAWSVPPAPGAVASGQSRRSFWGRARPVPAAGPPGADVLEGAVPSNAASDERPPGRSVGSPGRSTAGTPSLPPFTNRPFGPPELRVLVRDEFDRPISGARAEATWPGQGRPAGRACAWRRRERHHAPARSGAGGKGGLRERADLRDGDGRDLDHAHLDRRGRWCLQDSGARSRDLAS